MFAINMTSAPRVQSYDDAVRVLCKATEKVTTHVQLGEEFRIPGKQNSPQMSVRKTATGIAFRYHHTDVIEWHRDNSYTLTPWSSVSTCTFFGAFSPFGHYLTKNGHALVIDGTAYALAGSVTVANGEPAGSLGWFQKRRVDREEAKRVLAGTKYEEYRIWYKTFRPMLEFVTPGFYWSNKDIIDILEDTDMWVKLATGTGRDGSPAGVRRAIYDYEDCYWTEGFTSVPSHQLGTLSIDFMRKA